jgi:hypothetical protein
MNKLILIIAAACLLPTFSVCQTDGNYTINDYARVFPSVINIDDKEGGSTSYGSPHPWINAATKNWMSYVPDDTRVQNMSIPATHNTATSYFNDARIENILSLDIYGTTVRCQTWTITQQLEAGIRMFDLRLQTEPDEIVDGKQTYRFNLQHGSAYVDITMDQLLDEVQAFLDAHPTEVILYDFQYEGSKTYSDHRAKAWDRYESTYSFLDPLPSCGTRTLGEVRGKMVRQLIADNIDIVQNYYAVAPGDYEVQTGYPNISLGYKVRTALSYMTIAQLGSKDQWVHNFLSGATHMPPRMLRILLTQRRTILLQPSLKTENIRQRSV